MAPEGWLADIESVFVAVFCFFLFLSHNASIIWRFICSDKVEVSIQRGPGGGSGSWNRNPDTHTHVPTSHFFPSSVWLICFRGCCGQLKECIWIWSWLMDHACATPTQPNQALTCRVWSWGNQTHPNPPNILTWKGLLQLARQLAFSKPSLPAPLLGPALTVPWVGLGFELLGTAHADFVG